VALRSDAIPITREFIENTSEKITESGCWIWMGRINGKYAKVGDRSLVHRSSYELFKGDIPEGLYVMHSCDIPCCVNPDHLSVGTHRENLEDCAKKGRAAKKLTIEKVREIKMSTEAQIVLAKRYGIHPSCISRIKSGGRNHFTHVKV
jgi:hypothetical protein